MSKRKFIKPDDSDSEYEWEEAPSKIPKIPEALKNVNELSDFLGSYTTKSSKDVRHENREEERRREEKLLKDRLCVQSEVEEQKIDNNWLKRVYNRMKEQSRESGEDLMGLLRERYDSKTIDMMVKLCGYSRSYDKGTNKYESKKNRYSYSSQEEPHQISKSSNIKTDDVKDVEERYVTSVDLNEAAAALIKAELSCNNQKISKLKKKLDILREAQRRNIKIRLTKTRKDIPDGKSVMIEKSLKNGRMVPYIETSNKFCATSSSNKNSLSGIDRLLREEEATNADDNDWAFATVAGRASSNKTRYEDVGDCEYDGVLEPKRRQSDKMFKNEKQRAISDHKNRNTQVNSCKLCYKGMPKHLVLTKGEYFCLVVPANLGIAEFHWQLVPIDHISASTRLDEDAYNELAAFKTRIVEFYAKELSSECIFMETVIDLSKYPHTFIDCIPISKSRDMYSFSKKIFFKKSIDEAKSEWCQNKKAVEINGGDIRRTIPKEFPYFAVEFDNDGGLAFVIDDERKFSSLFGLEIVGSLLDKSAIDIRSRKDRHFNEQADAVLKYENLWKGYDLWKHLNSDSDDD